MTIPKSNIGVEALLRGNGHERLCKVSVKELDGGTYSEPISITDPDDNFPDGDYEVIVRKQTFPCTRRGGKHGKYLFP